MDMKTDRLTVCVCFIMFLSRYLCNDNKSERARERASERDPYSQTDKRKRVTRERERQEREGER